MTEVISLLSIVLLSTVVDYETLAKPLPSILTDLSKQTGAEMRASDALRDERLIIRVRTVEVDELRKKIAEAVAGKWTEKEGVLILQADKAVKDARYQAMLERRVTQIKKSFENFPKIGNSIENMGKYHSSGHTYRAAYEIVSKMDLSSMAAVPLGYRRVYSSAPTGAQVRIAGVDSLVKGALDEHNRIVDIALGLDIDEPAVGTPQYRARQALIKKWDGPLTFQLVCGSNEYGLQGMARFLSRGEVLNVVPISFNWTAEPSIPLPDGVDPGATVQLSKPAAGMARLMALNLWDGSTDKVEVDPESVAVLKKPTQFDPLSLHYSEILLEIAKQANWQLIACVRDEMVPMLPDDKPTLRSALDAFTQSPYAWSSLKEGWLTITPTELGAVQQIDRNALESFMNSCEQRMPSLEVWAKLAAKTPAPFTTALMMPYVKAASGDFGGGESQWLGLRFYNSLTEEQRRVARSGGTVQAASLMPPSRKILEDLTFYVEHPQVTEGTRSALSSGLDLGPSSETTDILPRGITVDMRVEFSTRNSLAVLPTPKSATDFSPYPMPVSSLAYNATVDPKVFINEVRPVFPTFRIGTMNRVSFSVPLRGNLQLQGFLYEYDIDKKSKVYELGNAPKEFKDAYDKAVKERGG